MVYIFVRNYHSQQLASAQGGKVDSVPANNGIKLSQDKWIEYFNNERKRMISAPNV